MRAAMEQHGNLFALLGNFGEDDATKIMNRVTPNRSAPSDKKKPQQQKNKKKQQSLKLAPDMLRAKPLVLPDHVLKRELVIRSSKKNDRRVHASKDVVVAQNTQEMAKVEDKNLTLKEYEKVQAEKEKKKNPTDVQCLEAKEEYTTVKKATKKVTIDLFSKSNCSGNNMWGRNGSTRVYGLKMIGWSPPPQGWVTLNTDGCSKGKYGAAGAGVGGLIRDFRGVWLKGFFANIGSCGSAEAEFWAAIYGLHVAWEEGFRRVLLETDSSTVADWLTKSSVPKLSLSNLISVCRKLLNQDWEVKVIHVYRERNRVADFLASESLKHGSDLTTLQHPIVGIQGLLWEDFIGIAWPRRVLLR